MRCASGSITPQVWKREAASLCAAAIGAGAAETPADTKDAGDRIRLGRLPEGGIQPQAALDDRGALHVVYFSGDPAGGNLFYLRGTGAPVRVNSQPGSA